MVSVGGKLTVTINRKDDYQSKTYGKAHQVNQIGDRFTGKISQDCFK
jgi:hypothetical protein